MYKYSLMERYSIKNTTSLNSNNYGDDSNNNNYYNSISVYTMQLAERLKTVCCNRRQELLNNFKYLRLSCVAKLSVRYGEVIATL